MKRNFAALLALILLMAVPAIGQEQTAGIQGVVTDESGASLPGVQVMAVSEQGISLSTYTDASGRYRFPSVPPGTYTITAELAGMESAKVDNLAVRLGSSPKVDLQLRVSAITESITVSSSAPIVDVTSSATATSMRAETFERLPLGRDFTDIAKLSPGAKEETNSGGLTINGASASENVFVVDGVNVTNPEVGTSGKVVITDLIEEVQVKSAGYAAEYGGAIGGVINVITKSGTNDFTGAVNLYYEDEDLNGDLRPNLVTDANNPYASDFEYYDNDDETTIEPGFILGGPIARDRAWFFAGYEPIIEDTKRTVTFSNGTTDTFTQDFRRDNGAATFSGVIGSKLIWKGVYNTSGYEQENLLPTRTGRTAATSQNDYVGRVDDFTNWTASAYLDYVVTPDIALSVRGGRFFRDINQSGYPSDPYVWFWRGSTQTIPGLPADLVQPNGFRSAPTPSATTKNEYVRDNMYFDVSWYPNIGGAHAIKAGVQYENLSNDVDEGFTNYVIRTAWNTTTPWWGPEYSGEYGQAGVYVFKTFGQVESKNTALFIQDSWTTMNDRLTLNLGLRAEQEKVPNYADPSLGLAEYAIEFDFSDKIAPRLGFAYDISGDGRWKAYGSYGTFYDITKMEMPRGSFGGDKWIWFNFAIDDPNWKNWNCTNVTTNPGTAPSCTGLSYIGNVNLRSPSLDLIEPDLKPVESEEITLGTQYELSPTMAIGARYIHKELVRTIEDVGVFVQLPGGGLVEEYFMANPGFGVAKTLIPGLPDFPKAQRDYDALELEMTKRFSGNWSLYANYVYSRLYGNYNGLANADEYTVNRSARVSPNVTRYGDSLFNAFDSSGSGDPVKGRLPTDRPHQFKAQLIYAFPFGTTASLNQYIGSGTPRSTEFTYHGVEFFANGRGDLGRTPTLTQSDLYVEHEFGLWQNYSLEFGVTVLNLFDEDTPIAYDSVYSETDIGIDSDAAFFEGFDAWQTILDSIGDDDPRDHINPQFNQPFSFQDPREVRFHVKLRF